jgi:hypothetical protein
MKALIFVIAIVAAGVWAYPRYFDTKDPYPPPPGVAEGSREHLKDIARQMKASFPKRIDSEITATDVFARTGEMVYTYQLTNLSSKEVDPKKFQELLHSDIRRRICGERDIKRIWKHHDITFSYQFIGSDGFSLGYMSVGPGDC